MVLFHWQMLALDDVDGTVPNTGAGVTKPDHEVVIIGAGIGGLGAAIGLKRAGVDDFVVFERAPAIGGTWYSNRYPDVGVDTPAFSYEFSYAANPKWSRLFPKGEEVRQYLDELVGRHGLDVHLRLGNEVMERVWDDDDHQWRLRLGDGTVVTARFVIAALGIFVEPKKPNITGLDSFQGKLIQAQCWDPEDDLTGKRIAVIGTGATAVQLAPSLANIARRLDVYQRRASWVFPKIDVTIPPAVQWGLAHVPGLQWLARASIGAGGELVFVGITVYGSRIAPITTMLGWVCRGFLFTQVRDRELRRKLTPEYGLGCKRPTISTAYYRMFNQPQVNLITAPIAEVTPTGILTVDGVNHEVDVVVLATGFELAQSPELHRTRPVKGRNGFDLADHCQGNATKAYEGVALPQLPNHFAIFGPFAWSGSSWHVMVENTARVAIRVITEARRRGATMVAVKEEAADRFYGQMVQRSRLALAKGPTCVDANSYYIDHRGEFSLMRPTTSYQATRASKRFSLEDFTFDRLAVRPSRPSREAVIAHD